MGQGSQCLKAISTKWNAEPCFYPFMHAQQRKIYKGWGEGCRYLISAGSCRVLSATWQRKAGSLQVPALSYRNENWGRKKLNKSSMKPYSGNYSPYASLGRKISHHLSLTSSYSQDTHMEQSQLPAAIVDGHRAGICCAITASLLHLVPLVRQPQAG